MIIAPGLIQAKEYSETKPKALFFHSPSCHECVKVKSEFMAGIERKFKDAINIIYLDINDIENYKLLISLKEQHGITRDMNVPIAFIKGHFLNGKAEIEKNLVGLIENSLKDKTGYDIKHPSIDLVSRFLSFTPLTVIGTGLIDGINPCAFAVIIFFISFLTLQGYRKKELAIIGLLFVCAVFLAYLMIGLGVFSFLYRLQAFWQVAKAINFSIGIISVILGVLATYDVVRYKKTRNTENLVLQLPRAVKNRIHSIIGMHYRKTASSEGKGQNQHLGRLAMSAFTTGFLVSLLEAVCTGQLYLPTITFVLKTSHLKLEAFGYLLLYNIMFIVPLLVILLFALLGVSSEQLSNVFRRHFLIIKILLAIVFLGLGFYLLRRA